MKSNFSGSATFSKTCLGIIQTAFQRTVKSAWKREFGFFSLNTTVLRSGADTEATLIWNGALQRMPLVFMCSSVVKTTSADVNSTPSLQKMPGRSLTVISVKSAL